jgi:tetratricopeptide (TPR) repeat protein
MLDAMVSSAATCLQRALALLSRGEIAQGRRMLKLAREEGFRAPAHALAAAHLWFSARGYHESMEAFDEAHRLGAGVAVLWSKHQEAVRLGWEQEARAALERGAAEEPGEPRWPAALLALHARRRDYSAALAHGEVLRGLVPHASRALIEIASLRAACGDLPGARSELEAALTTTLREEERLEVARLLRAVGAFPEARRLLASMTQGERGGEARVLLAELALWSGHLEEAGELVRPLAPQAPGLRILGAIAVLQGRPRDACFCFEQALQGDPSDSEAHAWLAQLRADEGRFEEAHEHTTRATMTARGQLLVAHLLRLRTNLLARTSEVPISPAHTDHLLPTFEALCPALLPALRRGELVSWGEAVEIALAALHGNRSTTPTWLQGAELTLLPVGPEPRAEARRSLERFRVAPVPVLLADLETLAERFPRSGLPDAHRGELLLWLGRVPEARQALERALSIVIGTRWAHIGLSMCDLLDGAPDRALETLARGVRIMHNTEGPAVYVHRGEALRLLGRTEEARVDLERSVAMHPARVGAWINLGLLRLDLGSLAGAADAVGKAAALAPGLISDAARVENVDIFHTNDTIAEAGCAPVLRRALVMLQGNRSSSCVSYLTPEGALRFGHHGGGRREALHGDDRRRWKAASDLLRGPAGASRAGG